MARWKAIASSRRSNSPPSTWPPARGNQPRSCSPRKGAVGTAVQRLYDESSAAMSASALEEAARHFGEAIGGVGLRILVTIAIGRLGGKLPEVPTTPGAGGLWTRLGRASASVPRVLASSDGASMAVATAGEVVDISEVAGT